jgi:hypothetical protein
VIRQPIGEEVLGDLLHAPVASESGLGIGLYHAARQAESCGYELRLASNERRQGVLRAVPARRPGTAPAKS